MTYGHKISLPSVFSLLVAGVEGRGEAAAGEDPDHATGPGQQEDTGVAQTSVEHGDLTHLT